MERNQVVTDSRIPLPGTNLTDCGLRTTIQAAAILGRSVGTLHNWRSQRSGGPRSFKAGGKVHYRVADLLAWVESEGQLTEASA